MLNLKKKTIFKKKTSKFQKNKIEIYRNIFQKTTNARKKER